MAPDMPRRDRRAGSKRARKRTIRAKTEQFFSLYDKGVSRGAMAQVLGLTTEGVDELYAALEQARHEDAVEAGGGGA